MWDVWNEPVNVNGGRFHEDERAKVVRVDELLPEVFAWARDAHPKQPLTSGVWSGNWSDPAQQSATTKIQLGESDVVSFHNYGWPEEFEARIKELRSLGRPLICTEYMARGNGSTFDTILPIGKAEHVALINWGFCSRKDTNLPAMGLVEAAIYPGSAAGMVSRHLPHRRYAVSRARDGTHPLPDGTR